MKRRDALRWIGGGLATLATRPLWAAPQAKDGPTDIFFARIGLFYS